MANIKVSIDGRLVISEALNVWIQTVVAAIAELKIAVDMDAGAALREFLATDAGAPLQRLIVAPRDQQAAVAEVLNVPDEEGFVSEGLTITKPESDSELHYGCVYLQLGPITIEVDAEALRLALRPFDVE